MRSIRGVYAGSLEANFPTTTTGPRILYPCDCYFGSLNWDAGAVFSLFDAALLRPFPYRQPKELIRVETYNQQIANSLSDASVHDFWDWRKLNRSFKGLAAYTSFHNNLTGLGEPQVIVTTATSPELFALLNTHSMLGRTFTSSENEYRGDVRKVVLSYGLWQGLFSGDPKVLNRVLRLGGESYAVIGVMPRGFEYPDRTQAWIPLMARYSTNADPWWKLRNTPVNAVLGRLKPDVSLAQAQADMNNIASMLRRQFPATNADIRARVVGLREAETAEFRGYVILVGISVLLLLAIGCINVASLFIARASARQREFAIRGALGATRAHSVRQLMGESLVYGTLGGLSGIALAFQAILVLTGLLPSNLPHWLALRLDWRVLLFSAAVSAATALLFGFAPLLGQSRIDLSEALKQGGKGCSSGTAAFQLRRGLIVVEVALSLFLLIGAGLMIRSFRKLMDVDTGVKTDHLIVATVTSYIPNASEIQKVKGYSKEFQKVCEKLATLPGVVSASAGDDIPYFEQPEHRGSVELFTKTRPTRDRAYYGPAASSDVMPGYFAALGIPLFAGRDFLETDGLDRPPVAIISRYTAETFFPDRSAIGEQIRWGDNDTYNPWSTVIGVAGNTKWNPAERRPDVEVYWSAFQYPPSQTNLLIRTTSSPQGLLPAVRHAVHEVSPSLEILQTKTMDVIVNETVWQHRLWSFVLGVFATLALFLTAVGLYGVMSYLVNQSTREIGIRMAMGSTPGQVMGLVAGRGLALVASGLTAGLLCTLIARRLLTSLLYGISDTDVSTYAAVVALLCLVAISACAVPAWRAARIDPLTALRGD